MKPLRARHAITLPAVRPSPAVAVAYERALAKAVDKMTADVTEWALGGPKVAMDTRTPAALARASFARVTRRWQKRFDALAPKLADYFTGRAQSAVDGSLQSILREAGFTVRFTMSAGQRNIVDAVVGQNVALIKSIASQYLSNVEGAVLRSVAKGGDLKGLETELVETTGVTKRRAARIAISQNRMATAALTNKRYEEMGIEEAKWLHSAGGLEPRPSHVAFSGKRYKVSTGAYLDEKWTYPGVEPGCKCVSCAVVPGWDD